jgi:hypothetical protein
MLTTSAACAAHDLIAGSIADVAAQAAEIEQRGCISADHPRQQPLWPRTGPDARPNISQ